MMKILVKKSFSLSMSSAKPLGVAAGDVVAWKQRHHVAKNHVNKNNQFFLDAIWCKPVDLRHLADKKNPLFYFKNDLFKFCLFN